MEQQFLSRNDLKFEVNFLESKTLYFFADGTCKENGTMNSKRIQPQDFQDRDTSYPVFDSWSSAKKALQPCYLAITQQCYVLVGDWNSLHPVTKQRILQWRDQNSKSGNIEFRVTAKTYHAVPMYAYITQNQQFSFIEPVAKNEMITQMQKDALRLSSVNGKELKDNMQLIQEQILEGYKLASMQSVQKAVACTAQRMQIPSLPSSESIQVSAVAETNNLIEDAQIVEPQLNKWIEKTTGEIKFCKNKPRTKGDWELSAE